MTLILKNNSNVEETAPRSVSVVFYKNNRPVYSKNVNFWFTKLNAGETTTNEFDIPTNYKKSIETKENILIDFDDIKIFRVIESNS